MPPKFKDLEGPGTNHEENEGVIIVLPDSKEMLARLVEVNDEPFLQERFYPILLKYAGQKRAPQGVVMMLALAIHEFLKGMPPVMEHTMYLQAPDYIDALIPNPEVAQEAKTFLQKALSDSM